MSPRNACAATNRMNPGRSNRPPSTSTNRSSDVWLASVMSSWTLRYFSSSGFDSCVVASKCSLIGPRSVPRSVKRQSSCQTNSYSQPSFCVSSPIEPVDAGEEILVDRLDECVEADVLATDVQPDVRFARSWNAEPLVELHRHRLVYARRILGQVIEDERLQPEEFLVGRVLVEVDLQTRFVARCASRGRANGCRRYGPSGRST